jgi:hypothetical protein
MRERGAPRRLGSRASAGERGDPARELEGRFEIGSAEGEIRFQSPVIMKPREQGRTESIGIGRRAPSPASTMSISASPQTTITDESRPSLL